MADIVFVVDSSGSIRSERFPLVMQFIQSIVENLDVGQERTRVGKCHQMQLLENVLLSL